MKSKERILSVLKGLPVDRTPWSPNPAYWWEAQSDELVNMGEVEFLKTINADPLIRGHYPMHGRIWEDIYLFDTKYKNCEVMEIVSGDDKLIEYITPVGTLKFKYRYVRPGNTWFLVQHGIKSEEDFKILTYFKEHTILTPNYKRFNEEAKKYGEDALLVAMLTPENKSSFQSLIEYWVGTEEVVYSLMDYPEVVEEAMEAMKKVSIEAAKICADSEAEVFTTWEDTSTTNISPNYYEKYILPEINEWCDIIHKNGKLYLQHACGHLKALMPLIAQSRIDCIESISPPPTGNIELWEARKELPPNIALIGGIEPTAFLGSSLPELMDYVSGLLSKMKGSRYILANSDSCPPGVVMEKFKMVSELIYNFASR